MISSVSGRYLRKLSCIVLILHTDKSLRDVDGPFWGSDLQIYFLPLILRPLLTLRNPRENICWIVFILYVYTHPSGGVDVLLGGCDLWPNF